jgi:hypothetical protein
MFLKARSNGNIGNLPVLKWRLAMALQSGAEGRVAVRTVYRSVRTA